ncbi:MAG: GNAT family N-acetyltransferase [Anaerolineae bacterium]|nr:GNAT family N-acetyltransferase [Anaerolineae bacterium]MCI0608345.1 GNAT family N-acetyltransferase [Anaerolineae bacterium]
MNITIREYQDHDLESCKLLWRELTQHHRDTYLDQSIGGDDPGIYFERYLKKTNLAGLWVAEAGSVIGMAGLLMDEDEAEIEPIVIRSDFRSRGVGTLLIEKLKTEAKERGVEYLSIRPVARNVEAIKCFHRAGFALLGHLICFSI